MGGRRNVFYLAIRPSFLLTSVCPFVCCQSYEHDILETNEASFLQIGTSDVWVRDKMVNFLWSRGQKGQDYTMPKLDLETRCKYHLTRSVE